MSENIKKSHSKGCHNNCRIHYNTDFFSYYQYQYPYSPFYPYPAPPPVMHYALPQNSCPPLLSQYNYSPVIQQPTPLQQQSLDDYYSPHYNSRSLANESNYNDFRRPVGPLSAEDEYNWAIHISKILDEFINRDRNQSKKNGSEYNELKSKLDTSLRHLKEAEALNKTLIEAWEKRNEKQAVLPTVTSSEKIILPEQPLATAQEEVIQNKPSTVLNAENRAEIKDVVKPE